jgi:hypothetical protein
MLPLASSAPRQIKGVVTRILYVPERVFFARRLARLYPLEVTLKAERQICKVTPTLLPEEGRKVDHACRSAARILRFAPLLPKWVWEPAQGDFNLLARTQSQTEDEVVSPPLSLTQPKLEA